MAVYDREFYEFHHYGSLQSARIIAPVLRELFAPRSVIDFGCGTGGWLAAMLENGVTDVHGVEGPWIQSQHLAVDRRAIEMADLSRPYHPARRYDLALSLEVAEHLPPSAAATFVASLCAASDIVVFSAAVPGQGGTDHKNEQWPDYWLELFRANGYTVHDMLRPIVWDLAVDPWYAQNILLFARHTLASDTVLMARQLAAREPPMRLVHPGIFAIARASLESQSVRALAPALWIAIRRAALRRLRTIAPARTPGPKQSARD